MTDGVTVYSGNQGVALPVASDDIGGYQHQRVKVSLGPDGSATDMQASVSAPLFVRSDGVVSAQLTHTTQASVAAGSSVNLDSAQIGTSKTGRLLQVIVAASVPFKAVLQTLANGVATTRVTWFSHTGGWDFKPASRELITATYDAGAGADGFRVVVTNLTTGTTAADCYGTFFWDEV